MGFGCLFVTIHETQAAYELLFLNFDFTSIYEPFWQVSLLSLMDGGMGMWMDGWMNGWVD